MEGRTAFAMYLSGVAAMNLLSAGTAEALDRSGGRQASEIEDRDTRVPATPIVTNYPTEAAGDGNLQQGYNPLRWAEDWRVFRDKSKRRSVLDSLKYIPLGSDDIYLTLSGELRARMNYFSNPQGRKAPHSRQDSYRIFAGADLHLGPHFQAYGELARGPMNGENIGTVSGTLSNKLLVQQAFVDGIARIGDVDVGARIGRQIFIDGANLLIANRDNNTLQTALTGVRAWARGKALRADAFDLYYTTYGNGGIGDDPIDWGRRFTGVTAGLVLPKTLFGGSKLYLDPFFWRLRNRSVAWGSEKSREERIYVGAHMWGTAGRLEIAARFASARAAGLALPEFPGPLPQTLEEAYAVQSALIDLWPDEVGGWKVGKIAAPWSESLGADRYLGPIFRQSIQHEEEEALFPAIPGGTAIFEAEIGVVIREDVPPGRTEWTIDDARAAIGAAYVVVEAAGSPLATLSALGPLATISGFGNNLGLITGPKLPDLDVVRREGARCFVSIDGKQINDAPVWGGAGGPLAAIAFALGQAARIGRPLRRGQILSTGALTGLHEVAIGQKCLADFGPFGTLSCIVGVQPQRGAADR